MTFFRHFIERKDFDTLVLSNSRLLDDFSLPYIPVKFNLPSWWQRCSRTRFLPWVYGIECLYGDRLLPSSIVEIARQFEPDAVFTVAGSWDWTALAAQRVARQLGIPIIASFNDWFDYGWFPSHGSLHQTIERRFRCFYQEADLAFCTSEGMREALGTHPNSHVLYPTGAMMPTEDSSYQPLAVIPSQSFTVFFGGSLGDWYGSMLESLIIYCRQHYPEIRFRVFGSLANWSSDFDDWATHSNVYGGQLPFDHLRKEARHADLLLLPMGFDKTSAQVECTSFKTKFLDYLSFQRPILVWGPDYCSAVRTAREFDSADCVTTGSAATCAEAIYRLSVDPIRREALKANAQRMYCDRFHPDKIHTGLVSKIEETVAAYQSLNEKRSRK